VATGKLERIWKEEITR